MPQPIACLTSDWHLAHHAWSTKPELWGDSYFALAQLVGHCVTNNIPLLGAGDLLDTKRPDSVTVSELIRLLGQMRAANLPVYYTQGQHEMAGTPWLSLCPGAIHATGRQVTLGGVVFIFLDYTYADAVKLALSTLPTGVDWLVCHQVWSDFMGTTLPSECSMTDVPRVKNVLTGDFHEHRVIKATGATGQEITVYSPGSTCMQSINEPTAKAFFVLYDDGSVQSVPLRSRAVQLFDLHQPAELEEFLDTWESPTTNEFMEQAPEPLWTPAVRVRFAPTLDTAYKDITKKLSGRAHLFLSTLQTEATPADAAVTPVSLIETQGMLGCLASVCKPESQEYRDIARLLRAKEKYQTELAQMKVEAIGVTN